MEKVDEWSNRYKNHAALFDLAVGPMVISKFIS